MPTSVSSYKHTHPHDFSHSPLKTTMGTFDDTKEFVAGTKFYIEYDKYYWTYPDSEFRLSHSVAWSKVDPRDPKQRFTVKYKDHERAVFAIAFFNDNVTCEILWDGALFNLADVFRTSPKKMYDPILLHPEFLHLISCRQWVG